MNEHQRWFWRTWRQREELQELLLILAVEFVMRTGDFRGLEDDQ